MNHTINLFDEHNAANAIASAHEKILKEFHDKRWYIQLWLFVTNTEVRKRINKAEKVVKEHRNRATVLWGYIWRQSTSEWKAEHGSLPFEQNPLYWELEE